MDHPTLILGELREFKRAALKRLATLERGMTSLQRAEATRRGRDVAFSTMGGVLGAALTLITTWLFR